MDTYTDNIRILDCQGDLHRQSAECDWLEAALVMAHTQWGVRKLARLYDRGEIDPDNMACPTCGKTIVVLRADADADEPAKIWLADNR